MINVISIIGDGRSGSTILETIINSHSNVISVGECFRFWERYYKNETYCGCGLDMGDCHLWQFVDAQLHQNVPDYDPNKTKQVLKYFQQYRQHKAIHSQNLTDDFVYLQNCIEVFFHAIADFSGYQVIVESSKSVYWAMILETIPSLSVSFIHLERDLGSVASSWKKVMLLPEFKDENRFLLIKNDLTIIRTWLRVKYLCHKAHFQNYLFVSYRTFCNHSASEMGRISDFLGLAIKPPYLSQPNHAIAGNPVRSIDMKEIQIKPYSSRTENLSIMQKLYFSFIDVSSNLLMKFYPK